LKLPILLTGLICCVIGTATAGESTSFKTLRLEGNAVRWQVPVGGKARILTYAVAVNDVEFAGARNCGRMTGMSGLLAASHVTPVTLHQEMQAAFAMWEAVANLSFREAANPDEADILIGAQKDPEGWAFANVFYDTRSADAFKPISRSLICLNPEKRWKVGFDGDLRSYDLRYTLTHEIGHAIGLDHPSGSGQIMGYRYEEAFREPQPGDIAGAVVLYGEHKRDGIAAASEPAPAGPTGSPGALPPIKGAASRALPLPGN